MDSDTMDPAEALLFRAKLHVRGGKRRVSQNKIPAAIASFHDAFLSAMQRFFVAPDLKKLLLLPIEEIDLYDEDTLFPILKKSGIIDETFTEKDFQYLLDILDEAFDQKMRIYDQISYFTKFNNVMMQLGIFPFSENELPPEDPSTY